MVRLVIEEVDDKGSQGKRAGDAIHIACVGERRVQFLLRQRLCPAEDFRVGLATFFAQFVEIAVEFLPDDRDGKRGSP